MDQSFENSARAEGFSRIAGVDEAGRGPLAGPVVAAAVLFAPETDIPGVNDSKKLTAAERERLFPLIRERALACHVAVVDRETIDRINILQASLLAMREAVLGLEVAPDLVLVDGNRRMDCPLEQRTVVGGDARCFSIAAASILAKVVRDRLMDDYHQVFPQYGFDRHKGYGTQMHRERIRAHGPCPIHRLSFRGVREFVRPGAGRAD